jgi:DNA-binding response OmpR family regulator
MEMVRATMKDKRVLIIDDEIDFGFLMTDFFSRRGGKVFIANSIKDGLRVLENEKPDLIFLDNNLPDGFGWGKTEYILGNYPNAQLILIVRSVPKTSSPSSYYTSV